jgi:hypothetical protein
MGVYGMNSLLPGAPSMLRCRAGCELSDSAYLIFCLPDGDRYKGRRITWVGRAGYTYLDSASLELQ